MSAPALRGHHLICLHFFAGEGYSAEFVDNLRSTLGHLRDAPFRLVEGPDDVCAACPSLRDGACASESGGEEHIRSLDSLANELLGVTPGMLLDFAETRTRLPAILDRWRASACETCGFQTVCGPMIDDLLHGGEDVGEGDASRP